MGGQISGLGDQLQKTENLSRSATEHIILTSGQLGKEQRNCTKHTKAQ